MQCAVLKQRNFIFKCLYTSYCFTNHTKVNIHSEASEYSHLSHYFIISELDAQSSICNTGGLLCKLRSHSAIQFTIYEYTVASIQRSRYLDNAYPRIAVFVYTLI